MLEISLCSRKLISACFQFLGVVPTTFVRHLLYQIYTTSTNWKCARALLLPANARHIQSLKTVHYATRSLTELDNRWSDLLLISQVVFLSPRRYAAATFPFSLFDKTFTTTLGIRSIVGLSAQLDTIKRRQWSGPTKIPGQPKTWWHATSDSTRVRRYKILRIHLLHGRL